MRFSEMGLRPELTRALDEIGYQEPTPIQEQAIPKVLEGRDLMCSAQTGTGKTAAFALPILQKLADGPRAELRVLVLVPTRELAMQVGKNFTEYSRHLGLVTATVYGGVPIEPQQMVLRHGADILVATPGRLRDHLWRGNIDFRNTTFLVLDEADRMLDMGFIDEVREIVSLIPKERQSMLFSATLDREIQRLSKDMLKSPVRIEVAPPASTLDTVEQMLVRTSSSRKGADLEDLIRQHHMRRAIIFARTKSGASRLAGKLRDHGHRASAIHSDRTQSERVRALEGFRAGKIHFLVATDIASRGLDVDDVSHVINYDLPRSPEDYVHRIGRTARAGRTGTAFSMVTPEDSRGVAAIERLISRRLLFVGDTATPPRAGGSNGGAPAHARNPRQASTGAGRGNGARADGGSAGRPGRGNGNSTSRTNGNGGGRENGGRTSRTHGNGGGGENGGRRRRSGGGRGRTSSGAQRPAAEALVGATGRSQERTRGEAARGNSSRASSARRGNRGPGGGSSSRASSDRSSNRGIFKGLLNRLGMSR